jgi:ATP-binding protein involved in chromosome partitioning
MTVPWPFGWSLLGKTKITRMDAESRYLPTGIRQRGPRELQIDWSDGAESRFDVRRLRLACCCAHCVDEWTGEDRLDSSTVPDDVHPLKIQPVGRYAIQIDWSDGHSTGIYAFRQLRELSERT